MSKKVPKKTSLARTPKLAIYKGNAKLGVAIPGTVGDTQWIPDALFSNSADPDPSRFFVYYALVSNNIIYLMQVSQRPGVNSGIIETYQLPDGASSQPAYWTPSPIWRKTQPENDRFTVIYGLQHGPSIYIVRFRVDPSYGKPFIAIVNTLP